MASESKENLIYIDDLSGLYNRRYLYFQLPKDLSAAQEQKTNLWLFMLDVDNFKIINDTYGHLCGDEVLKEVVQVLRENTKSEDKKIRYAGDEFTIILPKIDEKDVISVAQRLVAKMAAHHFRDTRSGKEVKVSISVGIAGYPKDTTDAVELINLADKALYISKQKGKNCVSTSSEITPDLFWKKDILERFPCPVLVERNNELVALKGALAQAENKSSTMTLLSGELGIGKTRLISEFERFAISQQLNCLLTRCVDKFVTQPYYILGEGLDRFLYNLDKFSDEYLEGIPGIEVAALFKFLPVLKDVSSIQPADIKDEILREKDYLGQGIIKLIQNVSRQKPVCIVIDDLQYADAQSLGIIMELAQHKQNAVMILASFCLEELSVPEIGASPLAAIINQDAFRNITRNIELTPLSAAGVKEMISNLFVDIPISRDFPEIVTRITKGNPLFVEELLKYVIEKEIVSYKNGKWTQKEADEKSLPQSIEDTIKARLVDLSEETKEMIAKAAVIGEDFQVDLLQKIDSEDRGYVLDLIESAKKIGLVYEKGILGKDEFSFVTNEIRQILFKTVAGERKKHFYSRLGEIKEKLYGDNINSIAGELYYNFKKAEDVVRAEQYANIVKEGRSAFYDRTMKYAQSLLEEAAVEKTLQFLSKKAWVNVPELIRSLYVASVNYTLYPPQNRMRMQSIEEIYKRLVVILSETNMLNIASIESNIIVNNRKVGKELLIFFANSFMTLLRNLSIESITFKKGVEQRELSILIDIISKTERGEESFADILKKEQVSHIQINEVSYDALHKKSREKESLEEIMLVDYLLGKFQLDGKKGDIAESLATHAEEIAETVEKLGEEASKKSGKDKETAKAEIMSKTIQKLGTHFADKGSESWSKYKSGLAKTLLSMEPNLRANVLANQVDEKGNTRADEVMQQISSEMPDETIIDVLTNQYHHKDVNFDKMRRLLQRFLPSDEKKQKLTPVLKDKFKQAGASDEECDWIFEEDPWMGMQAEEKVNKILSSPTKTLIRILPLAKLGDITRDLLAADNEEHVHKVLEKLFTLISEGYLNPDTILSDFREILDVIIQGAHFGLLLIFLQGVVKLCSVRKELVGQFISIINPYLEKAVAILIERKSIAIIKGLIQIYASDVKTYAENTKVLEPVTKKLVDELVLLIDSGGNWFDFTEALLLLKDQSARMLISESLFEDGVPEGKYFEAYLRRRTLGKILEKMPKDVFISMLEERCSDARFYVLKNLIELIGATEDEEVIKLLGKFSRHPDIPVRKKAIFALRKMKGQYSAQILAEALRDEDEYIRQEAFNILKDRVDEYAKKVLTDYQAAKEQEKQ